MPAPRRFDPLRRDALGVQTRYPAVAKIVGRDAPQPKEDGSQTIPLYYGTGTLVAEVGEWGIVLSNWHVVSEARDSIVVKFPTFSSPARVILRDEIWDLAALLVRKPPRVAPIPISQEVPGVGDALWVAGYGKSGGLTEFQIQGGRVQNYALLVTTDDETKEATAATDGANDGKGALEDEKTGATFAQDGRLGQNKRGFTNGASTATPDDAFYYETLAVDKGVREGDSGGPIFNRYGELAGVLWGSNGESTMGTYCIRAQFFLTQAIGRLATLEATRRLERPNAPPDELLVWRTEDGVPDAEGSDVWARAALEASGVHPISQRPAYVAADGRETPENLSRLDVDAALKRVRTALTVAENATTTALPPSPPVFSPTFVSQQRLQNCVRPEVAEADFWATLTDAELTKLIAARASASAAPQVRETSAVDDSEAGVRLAYAAAGNGRSAKASERNGGNEADAARLARTTGGETPSLGEENERTPARWRPVGFDGENDRNSEKDEKTTSGESRENEEDEEGRGSAANGEKETKARNGEEREDLENRGNGEDAASDASENASEANDGVEEEKETKTAEESKKKEEKEEKRVKFNGVYLNDFQVYLIVCMIFCLFYNAARLMTEADAKRERQKRQKRVALRKVD